MALFKYQFVAANQRTVDIESVSPYKAWFVTTVNGKPSEVTGKDLYEYSNRLGQETWDLVSDSVSGTSRELVFKYTTI